MTVAAWDCAEVLGRKIAVFKGNPGHIGCEARINHFTAAVMQHCPGSDHRFSYEFYADFTKDKAQSLAVSAAQDILAGLRAKVGALLLLGP